MSVVERQERLEIGLRRLQRRDELGAFIEATSGISYYDYVRDNVFEPAGMTSADSLPESEDVPNRAIGYMRSGRPVCSLRDAAAAVESVPIQNA